MPMLLPRGIISGKRAPAVKTNSTKMIQFRPGMFDTSSRANRISNGAKINIAIFMGRRRLSKIEVIIKAKDAKATIANSIHPQINIQLVT